MLLCPLGDILLWGRIWVKGFYRKISGQTNSCKPASVSDTVLHEWTLPRAKKVSTGHFFTEVSQLPPPSSSHFSITKKEHHPNGWCSFLVAEAGLEPTTSGYEPDELPTALLREISCTTWVPAYNNTHGCVCQGVFPVTSTRTTANPGEKLRGSITF